MWGVRAYTLHLSVEGPCKQDLCLEMVVRGGTERNQDLDSQDLSQETERHTAFPPPKADVIFP